MDTLKKIRRSISSTNTVQTTVPSGKIEAKKTWVHSPEVLLNGSVTYTLRLVGTRPVGQPKGVDVVREAIHAINFNNENKRAETSHEMSKLRKVDLRINVEGVTIQDARTKELLFRFPLKRISFCSDDKQDKRYLAFIANDGDSSHSTCLVFLSDKMSEEITRTIGEAFDLCYKKHLDDKGDRRELQNQRKILVLERRIAELEEENQRLSQLLAEKTNSKRHSHPVDDLAAALIPSLPSTPMPAGPPPSLFPVSSSSVPITENAVTPTGFLPPPSALASTSASVAPIQIAPPPVPTRRTLTTPTSTSPPLCPNNSIFDDEFNPRQTSANGKTASNKTHKTAAEIDSMIHEVDAELVNMQIGTGDFSLEVVDGGDAFREVHRDDTPEYASPRNILSSNTGK